MSANYEDIERLLEIKDEISALIGEARNLLEPTPYFNRASAYWIPQIEGALGENGREMCTIVDTINEMSPHNCEECGVEYDGDFCEPCNE